MSEMNSLFSFFFSSFFLNSPTHPPFPHMSHPVSPTCQKLILFRRRRARALVATPRQTRLLCLRRLPSDDRARRRCMRRFQGDKFSHPFFVTPFGHTNVPHPFCHTPFVTLLLPHHFLTPIFSHPFCHTPLVTPLLSHPFCHTMFSHHFLTPFLPHPFFSHPLSFACATAPCVPCLSGSHPFSRLNLPGGHYCKHARVCRRR